MPQNIPKRLDTLKHITKGNAKEKEHLETPQKMGRRGKHYKNVKVQIQNKVKIHYFKHLAPHLCNRREEM